MFNLFKKNSENTSNNKNNYDESLIKSLFRSNSKMNENLFCNIRYQELTLFTR